MNAEQMSIIFNFQRGNAPWWFLERLNGCGFLIFGFIAVNGRRHFVDGDGLNFSGKLPAAGRRSLAVGIAPVWWRGIKNPTPPLKFQKPVFAVARRFAAGFNVAAHFCPDALAGLRGGLAHVLSPVRLEPNYSD